MELNFIGADEGEQSLTLRFEGQGLSACEVQLRAAANHLEIAARFTPAKSCEINLLELFPTGTGLNVYDVVNFRNRQLTPNTWPELLVGGAGDKTDTSSGE